MYVPAGNEGTARVIVVGSPGTGDEVSGSADLPSMFVNLIELNFGSTASEKVIEIFLARVEPNLEPALLFWGERARRPRERLRTRI